MKKLLLASVISVAAVGCDNSLQPTTSVQGPLATCVASLHESTMGYQLIDGALQLTAVGQPTLVLQRDPTNVKATKVFGVWDLPGSSDGPLAVTGQLDIETGRITASSVCSFQGRQSYAQAVSNAFVTDQEIFIKTDDSESVQF